MSDTLDQAAFGVQIRQHGRLFYHVAFNILRSGNLAEDACQQALCHAWEKRQNLRDAAAFRGWIVRSVVRESLLLARKAQSEKRAMEGKADLNAGPAQRDDTAGFEQRESVLAAVAGLPDPLRDVVALRMLQCLSGNETAEILMISPAEVSRRLLRGMETLRRTLSPWSDETELKR